MDEPLFLLPAMAVAAYFVHMWLQDFRADLRGEALAAPLPGATPVAVAAVVVAVIGSLVLLSVEVGGEYALHTVKDQKPYSLLAAAYSILAAPFVEEIIFRGFLFYDKAGLGVMVLSCVAVSVIFALGHGYIWAFTLPDGAKWWEFWRASLEADYGTAAVFTTSILFANSLWWYFVRFFKLNPRKSLIPCIAGHAASNLGVFAIKGAQGMVTLW